MQLIATIVYYALYLFMVLLMGRAVLSFVPLLVREWKPKGVVLVLAEAVYTATDGPLRLVGRVIPHVRMGAVSFDLGFLLLFFLVSLAMRAVGAFLM